MKDNLCLITGGFDPIHQGHVQYIKSAKEISSYLVIGLNSDVCSSDLRAKAEPVSAGAGLSRGTDPGMAMEAEIGGFKINFIC